MIDYFHVFSYSDRPGTKANELPEKVHSKIIKERNAVLTRVSNQNKRAAHDRMVDQTLGVISEFSETKQRFHCGIADNFIRVRLPEGVGGGKEIIQLKIIFASDDYVTGELIDH